MAPSSSWQSLVGISPYTQAAKIAAMEPETSNTLTSQPNNTWGRLTSAIVSGMLDNYGQQKDQEAQSAAAMRLRDALVSGKLDALGADPVWAGYAPELFLDDYKRGRDINDYGTKSGIDVAESMAQKFYRMNPDGSVGHFSGYVGGEEDLAKAKARGLAEGRLGTLEKYGELSSQKAKDAGGTIDAVPLAPIASKPDDSEYDFGIGKPTISQQLEEIAQGMISRGAPKVQAFKAARDLVDERMQGKKLATKATEEKWAKLQEQTALLDDAEDAIKRAGMTGPYQGLRETGSYLLGMVSPSESDKVSATEKLRGIGSQLARTLRVAGEGAMSDPDFRFLMAGSPNPDNQPEANKEILARFRAANDRARGMMEFRDHLYGLGYGEQEVRQLWNKYSRANPLFKKTDKGMEINDDIPDWKQFFSKPKSNQEADPVSGNIEPRKSGESIQEYMRRIGG